MPLVTVRLYGTEKMYGLVFAVDRLSGQRGNLVDHTFGVSGQGGERHLLA
jgi:hypothetical protein